MSSRAKSLLVFKNVSVDVGGKRLLSNLNFELNSKEIVSLIGLNGTGKTSFLRTIIGFYKPSEGEIIINTDRVGYVPQKLDFDKTIPFSVEELLKTYSGLSREKIFKKLKEVGAEDLIDKMIGNLSGGQLQRVLIANALLKEPELLLLDEATTGVDVMGEKNFYELIEKIFKKYEMSIIMVSHDIHTVFSRSSKVVCISEGMKCCDGTPHDVSNHPAFKEIFGDYLSPYHHHHHD